MIRYRPRDCIRRRPQRPSLRPGAPPPCAAASGLDYIGSLLEGSNTPQVAVLASAFFASVSVAINLWGGLITERKRADIALEVREVLGFHRLDPGHRMQAGLVDADKYWWF